MTRLRIWSHKLRGDVPCGRWKTALRPRCRARVAGIVALVALVAWGARGAALAEPIGSAKVDPAAADKRFREVEDADARFRAGKFDEALDLFEIAVAKHPELPPALDMLAERFLKTNQLAAARNALERAIVEHPEDPEAYLILGDLAWNDRRIAEASLLFEKADALASALEEDSPRKTDVVIRAHAGVAAVAEGRKQYDIARDRLEAWIKLDEKNATAHHRLGTVLFGLGKPAEAYQELQAAAKLNDDLPPPELTMGRLYEGLGNGPQNQGKAEEWIMLAVAQAPEDIEAQLGVAQWLFENGKFEEAKEHAEQALKLEPESVDAMVIRGLVARFLTDYPAAEHYFEAAYRLSPSNFTASNQLALVLAEQEDETKLRRALELAELNGRQYPKRAEAAATLGWIYYRNKRLDEADRALEAAMSSGVVTADTAFYMARLRAHLNETAEAKRLLRSALDARGPFAYRAEAQKLFEELSKKS